MAVLARRLLVSAHGMESIECMSFSVDGVVVGLTQVVVARVAGASTAPNARLTLGLEACHILVRPAINALQASVFILDAVAATCIDSQALEIVEVRVGICLALSHLHCRLFGVDCVESNARAVHHPVVGCANSFRVACAEPICAPHTRLTVNLQVVLADLAATVPAAEAVQPVLNGEASCSLRLEACHLCLCRPGNDVGVHLRWSRALTDRIQLRGELCVAAHRRHGITAVWTSAPSCHASLVALSITVAPAIPID
mmetsp:Transcript_18093/g.31697  ORF Transcript_18093/g.31697 Transcript_18093/m.31697 type:complete len:256 (+) Transcript_18093:3649-4416(+)